MGNKFCSTKILIAVMVLATTAFSALQTFQFNGPITGDWTKGDFAIGDWGFKITPTDNYTISRNAAGVVTIQEIDGTKEFEMKLFYAPKAGTFAVKTLGFINSGSSWPNSNNNFGAQMHAWFGGTTTSIPEYIHTYNANIDFTAFGVQVVDTVRFTDFEYSTGYYNRVKFDLSNFVAEVVPSPRVASITRLTPSTEQTSATSLTWRVAFSEPVCKDTVRTNLNAADFAVTGTTATITSVTVVNPVAGTCVQSTYDVTVSGGNLSTVTEGTLVSLYVLSGAYDFPVNNSGYKVVNVTPTGTNNNYFTVVRSVAPTLTATASNPVYTENGSAVAMFSSLSASVVDAGQKFTSIQLTVTNLKDGANEVLIIGGSSFRLVNGAAGALVSVAGSYNVSLSGTTATVTISGLSLDNSQASTLLQGLKFNHTSDLPTSGIRDVSITSLTDNGVFNYTSSFSTIKSSVTVVAVNDAPIIFSNTTTLAAITEDATSSPEISISTLLSGASYNDVENSVGGVALTQSSGNGRWDYSLNGTTWTQIPALSASSSLLLPSTAKLRFIPNTILGGAAVLNYRAWDLTSGTAATSVETYTNGGSSAFSSDLATLSLPVTSINDAPALSVPSLLLLTEDQIGALTSISVSDIDAGAASISLQLSVPKGLLLATAGSGVTVNGQGTSSIILTGTVANLNAFIAASMLTYQPSANATGDVLLSAVVDDLGNSGGTSATSSASIILRIASINDAPTIVPGALELQSTDRHTASAIHQISDLLNSFQYTDVDASAMSGIAITASSGPGAWQYSLDGNSWIYYSTVSNTQAYLLPSSAYLRFAPSAATDGVASLQFRAWDRTTGVVANMANTATNGGSSAYSTALAELTLPIKTNEPPTAIHLSNTDIVQSQGPLSKVADLTSDDPEGAVSFTYSLVTGYGGTHNDYFQVDGATLLVKDPSTMPAGSYNIRLQTAEGANTFEAFFSITMTDDVAPEVPVIATQTFATRVLVYSLQGVAEKNSVVSIYLEGDKLAEVTADDAGQWTYQVVNSPEGLLHYKVQATDVAGNQSLFSTTLLVTVDATAPNIPVINEASFSTASREIPISGSGDASTNVRILVDGDLITLVPVKADGKWSYTWKDVTDGEHTLAVQGVDALDNSSNVSAVVAVFVDATAPVAPVIASAQKNGSALRVTGDAEPLGVLRLLVDGKEIKTATVGEDGHWNLETPLNFSVGKHMLEATVTDTLGNQSSLSLSFSWTMEATTAIFAGQPKEGKLLFYQNGRLHYSGLTEPIVVRDYLGRNILSISERSGSAHVSVNLMEGKYIATSGRTSVVFLVRR